MKMSLIRLDLALMVLKELPTWGIVVWLSSMEMKLLGGVDVSCWCWSGVVLTLILAVLMLMHDGLTEAYSQYETRPETYSQCLAGTWLLHGCVPCGDDDAALDEVGPAHSVSAVDKAVLVASLDVFAGGSAVYE
jgi:hypothetical protein